MRARGAVVSPARDPCDRADRLSDHGVRVADWPADPRRTDRELPGLGISRTTELVDALALSGFAGSLDVEIFGDPERFWGLSVDEAARRAYAAAAALT